MQRRYFNMIEELKLRNGIAEVGASAAKVAAGETVKYYLVNIGTAALQNVAEEIAKTVAGAVAGPLLQLLLKVADGTAAKLDKQIRAPFRTGVRTAKEVLELPYTNNEQVLFRAQRLNFAIDQLEIAWTNAENLPSQDQDRLLIRLLQGFCAREMPGGLEYAHKRLKECADLLEPEVFETQARAAELDKTILALREQADDRRLSAERATFLSSRDIRARELGPAWSRKQYKGEAAQLELKAQQRERERESLVTEANYLADLIVILRSM